MPAAERFITGKEWLPSSRRDVDFLFAGYARCACSLSGDALGALGRPTSFSLASASGRLFFDRSRPHAMFFGPYRHFAGKRLILKDCPLCEINQLLCLQYLTYTTLVSATLHGFFALTR